MSISATSMLIGPTKLDLGLESAVDDYRRLIDNAAALGSKWLLGFGTSKEEQYEDYYEMLCKTVPHAGDVGVSITLKPHGGITLDADYLLEAVERVNHPAFGICMDPGNIIYYTKGAQRPETDVDRLAPKVNTGIIKDCSIMNDTPEVMVTPGEGLVDFERILGGLTNNGFRGPLYVECVGGTQIDEIDRNVKATRKFVEDILAKL